MPTFTHAPVSQCSSCSTDLKGQSFTESPLWPGIRCEDCAADYFIQRRIPRYFICMRCRDTFASIHGHCLCFSCRSKSARTFAEAHAVASEAAQVLAWQLIHAARIPAVLGWLEAGLRRVRLFAVQARRRMRNDENLRMAMAVLLAPPAVLAFLYMPL